MVEVRCLGEDLHSMHSLVIIIINLYTEYITHIKETQKHTEKLIYTKKQIISLAIAKNLAGKVIDDKYSNK